MKLKYPLNPVQRILLETFSWCNPNDTELAKELNELILKFFQDRVDRDMDQICKEKGIDENAVRQMLYDHDRIHNLAAQEA
jgi:hypothetical protein